MCLSFTPYDIVKTTTTKNVLFLCTLIHLDGYRLIMIAIAGRAANEFLCKPKNLLAAGPAITTGTIRKILRRKIQRKH